MLGIKEKNRKIRYLILTGVFLIAGFLFISPVLAQTADNLGLTSDFAATAGLGTTDIRVVIAQIIRAVLGLLGIIAVSLALYGGFIYMTAGGNEEKVKKAKRILRDALIGLIIILASFSITQFILSQLQGAMGVVNLEEAGGPGGAALGAGPIESHYPARNATGIPRNTNIIITFKEKIIAGDIISGGNITDNIKICEAEKCASGVYLPNNKVNAAVTTDQKTFVFDPADLLGSADKNMSYKVFVNGAIGKVSGKTLFLGQYSWQFEVSTIVDVTPPTVISVIPRPDSTNPRNTIVQINFSEGVNPITASGSSASLTNISVVAGGVAVKGWYYISNQYKTVEFIADEECKDAAGNILQNSCGGKVYCLPGNQELTVKIKAATIGSEAPTAKIPTDGLADLANNSLDGNLDGKAGGPASDYIFGNSDKTNGDNVVWKFKTDNTIDLTPPEIQAVVPVVGEGYPNTSTNPVPPTRIVRMYFSKFIMSSSLKPDSNYTFVDKDGVEKPDPFEYVNLVQPEPPTSYTGDPAVWRAKNWVGFWLSKDEDASRSIGKMSHGQLMEFSDYRVRVGSGVKDTRQNCFFPSAGPKCTAPAGTLASPNCEAIP